MKKILILLLTCLSLSANAANVIWRHSFSDEAVVHSRQGTYSITDYAENVMGDLLYNVAYMMKDISSGTYLDFMTQGVYLGDINWVDAQGAGGLNYIILQDAILGDVNIETGFPDWDSFTGNWGDYILELSLYDEDSDTFTPFAVSDIFTITQFSKGVGGDSSVLPPATEVWLTNFYTDDYVVPVPEPSVVLLGLIGICVCLFRRNNTL